MPCSAASAYWPGFSERSFARRSRPSGSRATMSVKVPPRSIQKSQPAHARPPCLQVFIRPSNLETVVFPQQAEKPAKKHCAHLRAQPGRNCGPRRHAATWDVRRSALCARAGRARPGHNPSVAQDSPRSRRAATAPANREMTPLEWAMLLMPLRRSGADRISSKASQSAAAGVHRESCAARANRGHPRSGSRLRGERMPRDRRGSPSSRIGRSQTPPSRSRCRLGTTQITSASLDPEGRGARPVHGAASG